MNSFRDGALWTNDRNNKLERGIERRRDTFMVNRNPNQRIDPPRPRVRIWEDRCGSRL